ncbi:chaplin [Streptomyces sp. NPDC093510]|uniref:chaplin n=1 Tax=Streptomyces sp. NPDC093510 TaxID=3155199 RepID=UPI003418627C
MRTRSILAVAALVTAAVIGGAGAATATADSGPGPGADATGKSTNSPGVLSGNVIQVPVDVAANVCGNTVSVVGLLNSAAGNACPSQ